MSNGSQKLAELLKAMNDLQTFTKESTLLWDRISKCKSCYKGRPPLQRLIAKLAVTNKERIKALLCPDHLKEFQEYDRKWSAYIK